MTYSIVYKLNANSKVAPRLRKVADIRTIGFTIESDVDIESTDFLGILSMLASCMKFNSVSIDKYMAIEGTPANAEKTPADAVADTPAVNE